MSTLVLLTALFACGPVEPPPEAPTSGVSMAESLRRAAAAGKTAVPDRDPEAIPDRLERESRRAPQPDPASEDSEACLSAKRARDRLKAKIDARYENRIRPAEDRSYAATLALNACLRDMGGCGANPAQYKAVADRAVSADRALQAELDGAGESSASLFPLNREVSVACGLNRY